MEMEVVQKLFTLKPEESVTLKGQSEVVLKMIFGDVLDVFERKITGV